MSATNPSIPGEKSRELMARRQEFVARRVSSYTPGFAAKAEGAIVWDVDGNRYIDFAGGIGTMNIGHTRPEVTQAIIEQAQKFTHTCFSVMMYEPYIDLAERIVKLTPGIFPKKAIFFNSGAEAVENAVKIARYATEVYRVPFPYPYRMNMTPQEASDFCIGEIERMFTSSVAPEQVAAIVIEPVQGEGGFMPTPPGFLNALKQLAEKHGILFVADEIQSGFYRTGKLFAVEHDNVEPDLVIIAKSMGAGMPISGVVGKAEIMDAAPPGTLGGTYSGNPLACAAALAVLDLFEKDDYAARSTQIGKAVMERFLKLQQRYPKLVGDVRGLGAMVAMELVKDPVTKEPDAHAASDTLTAALQRGLVLIKAGMYDNVLRILVPLCVTDEQLQQGLDIFDAALTSVADPAPAVTSAADKIFKATNKLRAQL